MNTRRKIDNIKMDKIDKIIMDKVGKIVMDKISMGKIEK